MTTPQAFPGTEDTRTVADVDVHIKAANGLPEASDFAASQQPPWAVTDEWMRGWNACREAVAAALAAQKVAQAGWKLVPVEPTTEMLAAILEPIKWAGGKDAYQNMLAAAPSPDGKAEQAEAPSEWQQAQAISQIPGQGLIGTGAPIGDFVPHRDHMLAHNTQPEREAFEAFERLDTYRPVWLQYGVTMHRDVTPNDAGWVKREDVRAMLATQPTASGAGERE
jgi:hypothetical protein